MVDLKFIEVVRSPSPEILDLLTNNIIGTPGQGMLYQHLGVHHKIDRIARPYYLNLSKRNRLIGTCCFCSRSTTNTGSNLRSFYVRYFSFRNFFRRKSISERSSPRHSPLRDEVNRILDGQFLDVDPRAQFFHYAYVDPRNTRSLTLCNQFGFQTVREYTTIIFNRIRPTEARDRKVAEVPPSQAPEVKQLLTAFYKDFTMFSFDNLFNGSRYYVIRDANGRIVAGAQATPIDGTSFLCPAYPVRSS